MEDGVTLIREATALDQPEAASPKRRWRGWNEAELREAVEQWGRSRWPDARVCHELVLNRGTTRLDLAFVAPRRLVVVELKSSSDVMDRVIHQVALARLAACEAWLVCDGKWEGDMRLVHYLLPSVGVAVVHGATRHGARPETMTVEIMCEPDLSAKPHALAQASVLWVSELAQALGIGGSRPGAHLHLAQRLAALPEAERVSLVCRQLRGRDALWRADPPIRPVQPLQE